MNAFSFNKISSKMHVPALCQMSAYTRSSLVLYRIPEVIFILAAGGVAVALAYSGRVIPPNRMTIPDITYTVNGVSYSVNNPTNSYPIKLNGFTCVASDLYACIAIKEGGGTLPDGCCTALYDINIDPFQTVTNAFDIFLGIIIPFIVFIVRAYMWRVYITRKCSLSPVAHVAPTCSSYFSPYGWFSYIFSVTPMLFDHLIKLHGRGGGGNGGYTENRRGKRSRVDNFQESPSEQRLETANDGEISDDARYEIIDSQGNAITKHRVEGREGRKGREGREGRDIELAERGEISDVLNESFLDKNAVTTSASPLQHMFWLLLLYEPSFALAVSSAFQAIIVLGLKRYVGAPRPNYYALVAWTSVYVSDRAKDAASARFSFPSGHSATAAGGLGVLILVLLRDIKHLKRRYDRAAMSSGYSPIPSNPNATRIEDIDSISNVTDTVIMIVIFTLLVMLSVCLVIWIGGSRIKDYYHFAPDVIGTFTPYVRTNFFDPRIPPIPPILVTGITFGAIGTSCGIGMIGVVDAREYLSSPHTYLGCTPLCIVTEIQG